MKPPNQCLCCASANLVENVRLLVQTNRGGERPAFAAKDRQPFGVIHKGRERSDVNVILCADCGYLHLFAKETEAIRKVKQEF